MTEAIRIGVQLWQGGTPDYRGWRDALFTTEIHPTAKGYDVFRIQGQARMEGRPMTIDNNRLAGNLRRARQAGANHVMVV